MSNCKYCGKTLIKEDKKFCNCSCAASYNNKKRKENGFTQKGELKKVNCLNCNKEIDVSVFSSEKSFYCEDCKKEVKPIKTRLCVICSKEFKLPIRSYNRYSNTSTCSEECHKELFKQIGKETYQKQIKKGTFKGWTSRNITSYAEKFWQSVLDNNNIEYKREVKVGKYFLDFQIIKGEKILDLEIDGKQHKYEDRKESDIERDKFLEESGYIVYRIPWNSINNNSGKAEMGKKINDFISFYNNL